MRILFIHNRYKQYGGEDVVVESESSMLLEKGHDVRTLIFDNKSISNSLSKFTTAFRSVYNFSSAKKVSKVIIEFKPDIIHVHNLFFVASPSILFAANRHNVPVILTIHNYRLICANGLLLRDGKACELCINKKFSFSGIQHKCYRNSALGSAIVTTITSFHKLSHTWKNKIHTYITLNDFSREKLLHSSLDIPANKMITKPNFAPDLTTINHKRESFFLFAGRIVKEKGVQILTQAFAAIPDQKIIIIGDGPEKELLQQQFISYKNIQFTGQLTKPEVNDYMKRCKAFICPSIWYEGAPLTIIEAFATGTPVIASRLGSMEESIADGFNGLHFNPGDAEDLREKIKLFIAETNNNDLLYKNARQTYLEKYHPDVHYKAIMNIYKNAIAGNA